MMRWPSNMLPAERNLYLVAVGVVLVVVAAFIATSRM